MESIVMTKQDLAAVYYQLGLIEGLCEGSDSDVAERVASCCETITAILHDVTERIIHDVMERND